MKFLKNVLIVSTIFWAPSCNEDDPVQQPQTQNTAPTIAAQSFNVSEAALDTDVLGTVKASDADSDDELSFSITSNDNDLFKISTSGDLSLSSGKALDFETAASHDITVEVTDGEAKADAVISLTVVDVDENTAPVIADQSFDIAENNSITAVVGTIAATDAEGDDLTFSWPGDTDGRELNVENTGVIKALASFNHEVKESYALNVLVSDGTFSSTATITVNVTNTNDIPVFSKSSYEFSAAENIDDTSEIGGVLATDEDRDRTALLTYKIVQNGTATDQLFEVDQHGGAISLQNGARLDYESKTSYNFEVSVSDETSKSNTQVTVNVTDVNESSVVNFVGNTGSGLVNAIGQAARFDSPAGMVKDAAGNIYVADTENNVIRKVDVSTGAVTTYAGDGTRGWRDDASVRLAAQFRDPIALAIDASGNLYVADQGNHRIRKITPTSVTTIAGSGAPGFDDGNATLSTFRWPSGIAVDAGGNIYVSDLGNHAIRKIATNGVVSTLAGDGSSGYVDGPSGSSKLRSPLEIIIDSRLNELYIADSGNKKIRTLSLSGLSSGQLSTLAVQGNFQGPAGLALDTDDGTLFIADNRAHKVFKAVPNTFGVYTVSTFAGTDAGFVNGTADIAKFRQPRSIVIDASGNLFVSDQGNNSIRKITVE